MGDTAPAYTSPDSLSKWPIPAICAHRAAGRPARAPVHRRAYVISFSPLFFQQSGLMCLPRTIRATADFQFFLRPLHGLCRLALQVTLAMALDLIEIGALDIPRV